MGFGPCMCGADDCPRCNPGYVAGGDCRRCGESFASDELNDDDLCVECEKALEAETAKELAAEIAEELGTNDEDTMLVAILTKGINDEKANV